MKHINCFRKPLATWGLSKVFRFVCMDVAAQAQLLSFTPHTSPLSMCGSFLHTSAIHFAALPYRCWQVTDTSPGHTITYLEALRSLKVTRTVVSIT